MRWNVEWEGQQVFFNNSDIHSWKNVIKIQGHVNKEITRATGSFVVFWRQVFIYVEYYIVCSFV